MVIVGLPKVEAEVEKYIEKLDYCAIFRIIYHGTHLAAAAAAAEDDTLGFMSTEPAVGGRLASDVMLG
jgi:hypothetical protein